MRKKVIQNKEFFVAFFLLFFLFNVKFTLLDFTVLIPATVPVFLCAPYSLVLRVTKISLPQNLHASLIFHL